MAPITTYKSSIYARFLQPISSLFSRLSHTRQCPKLPDYDWLICGIFRSLESVSSGREFLQLFASRAASVCPAVSLFFETLKSTRRCELVAEANQELTTVMHQQRAAQSVDPLAAFPQLEPYEVFAGDGHHHCAALHDPRIGGTRYPVGHLYTLNLRTRALTHLCTGDQPRRKREHDMHALKRLSAQQLRQGTAKGRKIIYVWDRAGIDFRQWYKWKQASGIYFISRTKENMVLEVIAENRFEPTPTNAGVLRDELVAPSSGGVALRRVTYVDPCTGNRFEFLTNLSDTQIDPGIIALLYKLRWDIEKVFDELKSKLREKKAWATSTTAKTMQANFLCLCHNLMVLFERLLETEENIRNEAEIKRRRQRLVAAPHPLWPIAPQCFEALTVRSVKFIRWLRIHCTSPTSYSQACDDLRLRYASL